MLKNWKTSRTIALLALVGVCAAWGSTFLVVQQAVERMPVMDFLAVRFSVAALVMIAFRPNCLRGITFPELKRAILLGIVLGSSYVAQTYGLRFTTATVSGFITGLFVVFTPIVSWVILRRKINRTSIIAVVVAVIGLALISLRGWSVGFGELLTLGCAIFYAVHVMALGEWSPLYDSYRFAMLQIATVAVLALVAASPGGITLPPDAAVWGIVGITAILATALAFLVQTWAQSLVSTTLAAIVMVMEPVFAGIFGVTFGGNKLTLKIIFGALCVLAAMIMVAVSSSSKNPRLET